MSRPTQFFFNRNGRILGPISEQKVRELCAEGRLRDTDLVSQDRDGGWLTVAEFREGLNQSASSPLLVTQTIEATSRWRLSHYVAVVIFAILLHAMLLTILAGVYVATRHEHEQLKLVATFSTAKVPVDAPMAPEPVPIEISPQPNAPTEGSSAGATSSSPNPGDATVAASAIASLSPIAKLESAKSRVIDPVLRFRSEGVAGDGAGTGAGGGANVENLAIEAALNWLCTIQQPDGRWTFWDVGEETTRGVFESDLSATGLALLCLIRSDSSVGRQAEGLDDLKKRLRKETRQRGLRWLQDEMHSYLSTGSPSSTRSDDDLLCYGHPIATMCLCEALTAEPSNKALRDLAIRAVDDLQERQDFRSGGWGYQKQDPANLCVTGWSFLALHSARIAEIPLYERTLPALEIYTSSRQTVDGIQYRYRAGDIATPSMTAVGALCRLLTSSTDRFSELQPSIERISTLGVNRKDAYFNFFAAQLMYQSGDEYWKAWDSEQSEVLLETQKKEGAAAGSWPATDVTGFRGGQLYQTAMSLLTLTTKTTPRVIPASSRNAPPESADAVAVPTMKESSANTIAASETSAEASPPPSLPPVDEEAAALAEKHLFLSPIEIRVNDRLFTIGPHHPSPLVRDCFKNIELLAAAFGAKNLRLEDIDLTRVEKRGWIDGYNRQTDVQYKQPVPTRNFVVCWDFNDLPKRFPTQRYFSYIDPTGTDIAFEELIALETGYAICNALWTQYGVLDARTPKNLAEYREQSRFIADHVKRIGNFRAYTLRGETVAVQPHRYPFDGVCRRESFSRFQKRLFEAVADDDAERLQSELDALRETIPESDWEKARGADTRQRRFLYELFQYPERIGLSTGHPVLGSPSITKLDIARIGMLSLTGGTPSQNFVRVIAEWSHHAGFHINNYTGSGGFVWRLNHRFRGRRANSVIIGVNTRLDLKTNPLQIDSWHYEVTSTEGIGKEWMNDWSEHRVGLTSVIASQCFNGGFPDSVIYGAVAASNQFANGDLHFVFYAINDSFRPDRTFTSSIASDWLGMEIERGSHGGWLATQEFKDKVPGDYRKGSMDDGEPRPVPVHSTKLISDVHDRGSLLVALLTQTAVHAQQSQMLTSILESGFRRDTRGLIPTRQNLFRDRINPEWIEFLTDDRIAWMDVDRVASEDRNGQFDFGHRVKFGTYSDIADLMDNPEKIPPLGPDYSRRKK